MPTTRARPALLATTALFVAGATLGCGSSTDDGATARGRCGDWRELDELPAPELAFRFTSPRTDYFSPRAADLDGDGQPELLVSGGAEAPPYGEIVALDGASGALRWRAEAPQQLYGSPVFLDITGDGVDDVFVGGRNEAFLAVDGATGAVLWRFVDVRPLPEYYLYNFYTALLIEDQTGDGLPDLLVSNGGSDAIEPFAPRPPAHLVVLDASNGSLAAIAVSPDHEETYMSALIVPDAGTSTPTILFATGGETRGGGLWRTTLADVLAGDISTATQLVRGERKGVIAPPSLADFDGDGRLDLVVATFDGRLLALDGENDQVLWEHTFEDSETYTTPALGYFDDDDTPDVFAVFLHGEFPIYDQAERVLVSGRDGTLLWRGSAGTFTMAGDVAVDLDADGIDEVIFGSSDQRAELAIQHTLHLLDAAHAVDRPFGEALGATSPASPWVGDLDGDGCLDLAVAAQSTETDGYVLRLRVAAEVPERISWSGYLGTHFDSTLRREAK